MKLVIIKCAAAVVLGALGLIRVAEVTLATGPGFTVVQSNQSTIVTEGGAPDSFAVVLNSAPTSNVTLVVTARYPTEATVDKTSLAFTPANWSVAQTVTVAAVADALTEGCRTLLPGVGISVEDASSASEYGPIFDWGFPVVVLDTSVTPGLVITETSGSTTITESRKAMDEFSFVLNSRPCSDVLIEVASGDATQALVSSSSLPSMPPTSVLTVTIRPDSWDQPRTIHVTGVNDRKRDADRIVPVTLSVIEVLSSVEYHDVASQTLNVEALATHRARP